MFKCDQGSTQLPTYLGNAVAMTGLLWSKLAGVTHLLCLRTWLETNLKKIATNKSEKEFSMNQQRFLGNKSGATDRNL